MAKTLDEAGVKRLIREIKGANKDLHSPIAISSENTTESMAQNVKNIADYIEKAKAAGIADVNGMAVTCIIDDDYYGMGYLYSYDDSFNVQGVLVKDDLVENKCFGIFHTGKYSTAGLITNAEVDIVTSSMLVKGARKPIILTPDTTEVDEETYQKLLSYDVDVMLKTPDGEFCALTYEDANTDYLNLYFTCFSVEGETLGDIYIYAYRVEIGKNAPHTCTINILQEAQTIDDVILSYDYIKESTIFPLLLEIDLNVSSDENRKSRLELFEENWKELQGTNNLDGARFIGNVPNLDGSGNSSVLFIRQSATDNYIGCAMASDTSTSVLRYSIGQDGSLTITPLFSHLEAVILRSGSDSGVLNANKAAIEAYIDNIRNLGIDPDSGYIIPIQFIDRKQDYYGILFYRNDTSYLNGIVSSKNGNAYCNFTINRSDGSAELDLMERLTIEADLFPINTQLKYIETCMKFTEASSSNKLELDKYLVSVPNATVMHCTYKDVYAGTLYKINSDWYGLLVKNTNNPADNVNIKLSADGTIITSNSAQ